MVRGGGGGGAFGRITMKVGIREILFLSLMVGLLAASFFVFKKSTTRRDALQASIQTKQKALADLKQSTAGIEDLNRKIAELKQAITFFESKLPQEKEIDKILNEVSQMAEANALKTKTVKTLRSERAAGYSEQPIEIMLLGDFNGFYSFLLQLEKLPRITRVTNMDLTKITDAEGVMGAKVTLSIFFEPDTGASRGMSATAN
jgi:type IV pilus assembly protein PilO